MTEVYLAFQVSTPGPIDSSGDDLADIIYSPEEPVPLQRIHRHLHALPRLTYRFGDLVSVCCRGPEDLQSILSSIATSESQKSTGVYVQTIRGGYPYSPEQGLQLATAIAQQIDNTPPEDVNDYITVLALVHSVLPDSRTDLGFMRILNKNIPDAGYAFFLGTTRRHAVELPREEIDRACAELHAHWRPTHCRMVYP
ncbi:hypothetical protein NUW54_g14479 [Trametes sanguinea]|uniref:Uncharacterized protein n=1 Tax=Trametes sanguinea TaxID=158606 RepID=A0ACC1MCZ0_9APHY|nr:hypothetical protein NUW54_g14479 [Trametes sanguinea]